MQAFGLREGTVLMGKLFTPDDDDDENFQQVFKAKLCCQVKPIAPSGARLGSRQANANHNHLNHDENDDDDHDGDHDSQLVTWQAKEIAVFIIIITILFLFTPSYDPLSPEGPRCQNLF